MSEPSSVATQKPSSNTSTWSNGPPSSSVLEPAVSVKDSVGVPRGIISSSSSHRSSAASAAIAAPPVVNGSAGTPPSSKDAQATPPPSTSESISRATSGSNMLSLLGAGGAEAVETPRTGSQRGGRNAQEQGPDGWNVAGPTPVRAVPAKAGDLSNFGKFIANSGPLKTMGPSSVFKKNNRGRDAPPPSPTGSRRGGRNAQEQGPDGWNVAGPTPVRAVPAKAGDLSNFGKFIANSGPLKTMGPSSVFKKGDRGRDTPPPSTTGSISRATSGSNMFSLLGAGGADAVDAMPKRTPSGRGTIRKPSIDQGPQATPDTPVRKKLPLLPRTISSTNTNEDNAGDEGKPESDEEQANVKTFTEQEAKAKVEEDVKEFFNVRDVSEGEKSFAEMPDEHKGKLVDKLASKALDSKEADVKLVADLFDKVAGKSCPPSAFEEGLAGIIEFLDDTATDVPQAYTFMARMLRGSKLPQETVESLADKIFVDGEPLVKPRDKLLKAYAAAEKETLQAPSLSLPRALASARKIDDLDSVTYPEGIMTPSVELNQGQTKGGKYKYDRGFLLQFMHICKDKPDNLSSLDALGIERGAGGDDKSGLSLGSPAETVIFSPSAVGHSRNLSRDTATVDEDSTLRKDPIRMESKQGKNARKKQEQKSKEELEAKKRQEAEDKAKKEEEEREAKRKTEEAERLKQKQEARRKKEAEKAEREEERLRLEAEKKRQEEEEARKKNEEEQRLKMEAEERERADVGTLITWISAMPISVSGGFGDVFTGSHSRLGKVALKRPRTTLADLIRRFQREAAIWERLQHPHILKYLGTFTRDGFLYIVSPFIENGTLLEYIFLHPSVNRIKLLCEAADAISYLHAQNIVHGDIKANNLLVGDSGQVLLCDFGLTKTIDAGTSTAMHGAGSLRWQSPELLDGVSKSFESDVYAFGMTIAEVLTGDIPFSDLKVEGAVYRAVSRGMRPPKIPAKSPTGSSYKKVWTVAEACWSEMPEERISMNEALRLIQENLISPDLGD